MSTEMWPARWLYRHSFSRTCCAIHGIIASAFTIAAIAVCLVRIINNPGRSPGNCLIESGNKCYFYQAYVVNCMVGLATVMAYLYGIILGHPGYLLPFIFYLSFFIIVHAFLAVIYSSIISILVVVAVCMVICACGLYFKWRGAIPALSDIYDDDEEDPLMPPRLQALDKTPDYRDIALYPDLLPSYEEAMAVDVFV